MFFVAATIKTYEIGYALNDFSSLRTYLSNQGVSDEEMVLAGLVIESDKKKGNFYSFSFRLFFAV